MAVRYDTAVIGGGLGGLLAGAVAAKHGRRVLLVERMPYLGGRFTTVQQDGCALTTGALHLVPHGVGGPLASLLAAIGEPLRGVPRTAIASAFAGGRHVVWHTPFDVLGLLSHRGKADLVKMLVELGAMRRRAGNFRDWVETRTSDPTLRRLFERFTHFALSIRPEEVAYGEMRAVLCNVARHGLPCAPLGGCAALVEQLAIYIAGAGGSVLTHTVATRLVLGESGRVCALKYKDRRSGREETAAVRQVISDAGPGVTAELLGRRAPAALRAAESTPRARGLKLHVLSDRSLIPHNGIMFCLDTQRISGIVEVSQSVPSLVSPGMHMLDTFQVPLSDDFALERQLAIEDLRYVLGADFDRHCRVVRVSSFRGAWPVNRAAQGQDSGDQEPVPGLIMVGDAYKPSGYMMAEGVAASVRRIAPLLAR